MRPGQIIPIVFVFLFGISTLFEGGNNGAIGEMTQDLAGKAAEQSSVPEDAPAPVVTTAAAKVSAWAYDDEATPEDNSEDSDFAPAPSPVVAASLSNRPTQPVYATAGAAVAPEQFHLRER